MSSAPFAPRINLILNCVLFLTSEKLQFMLFHKKNYFHLQFFVYFKKVDNKAKLLKLKSLIKSVFNSKSRNTFCLSHLMQIHFFQRISTQISVKRFFFSCFFPSFLQHCIYLKTNFDIIKTNFLFLFLAFELYLTDYCCKKRMKLQSTDNTI